MVSSRRAINDMPNLEWLFELIPMPAFFRCILRREIRIAAQIRLIVEAYSK